MSTLTDEQYKVINEVVLAVLQTTQETKLSYLRTAVRNALTLRELSQREATVLSRVVRDISAEEVAFLTRSFQCDGIQLIDVDPAQPINGNILRVGPTTQEASLVTGLYSLGVLTPGEATWGGSGVFRFSPIAAKLLALITTEA